VSKSKRVESDEVRLCNLFLPNWLTVVIRIAVFERPLPADNITRRCVVFELQVPHQFAVWRDATYAVLSACSGGVKEKPDGDLSILSSYPSYKSRFSRPYEGTSLSLLPIEPGMTARESPHSHTTSNQIALNVKLSNFHQRQIVGIKPVLCRFRSRLPISASPCAMEITPDGPYKHCNLLFRVRLIPPIKSSPRKDACSTTITLHDYEAFGHLRAGHKLQWRNMLKELRRGSCRSPIGTYTFSSCKHCGKQRRNRRATNGVERPTQMQPSQLSGWKPWRR
jgi:hypothetical protein